MTLAVTRNSAVPKDPDRQLKQAAPGTLIKVQLADVADGRWDYHHPLDAR